MHLIVANMVTYESVDYFLRNFSRIRFASGKMPETELVRYVPIIILASVLWIRFRTSSCS